MDTMAAILTLMAREMSRQLLLAYTIGLLLNDLHLTRPLLLNPKSHQVRGDGSFFFEPWGHRGGACDVRVYGTWDKRTGGNHAIIS
jgi:hypothetical protein